MYILYIYRYRYSTDLHSLYTYRLLPNMHPTSTLKVAHSAHPWHPEVHRALGAVAATLGAIVGALASWEVTQK